MVEITECPICKGTDFQVLEACIDHTVSHETFHVKQCKQCQLGITSPRPENEKLPDYYKSIEYISHSGKSGSGIGTLYKVARSFSLQWKKNIILKHKSGQTILDVGCGTGEFLATMKKNGWKVTGVEPSDIARKKASALTETSIAQTIKEVPERKFDVITAWHVIEHVPDLIPTLLQLKALLSHEGTLLIAVPNYESPDAVMYKNYWAGYDVPRHLWHFSKKSMIQLLDSQGFKLIDIIPMKLDSYYVSLLSEKYKKHNQLPIGSMCRAFTNGFISNLKAGTNTNHSSLIYIARIHEE